MRKQPVERREGKMTKKPKMVRITIYMTDEMALEVKVVAKRLGISRSELVRRALRAYLDKFYTDLSKKVVDENQEALKLLEEHDKE